MRLRSAPLVVLPSASLRARCSLADVAKEVAQGDEIPLGVTESSRSDAWTDRLRSAARAGGSATSSVALSHVYASTLYVPPKQFFEAKEWAGITDWSDELAPYFDQAARMVGVVR